jgi:hypothetical protein
MHFPEDSQQVKAILELLWKTMTIFFFESTFSTSLSGSEWSRKERITDRHIVNKVGAYVYTSMRLC